MGLGWVECVCGRAYWPSQGWIHEGCATNASATNRVATNKDATNKEAGEGVPSGVPVPGGAGVGPGVDESSGRASDASRTKNRRSREAYNAYQREYMRRRRAG